MQRNQVREVKEVSWSETEANKCNFEADQTATQTECRGCRSNYLYERNPLQDPRFTRLVEQLVPLRTQLHVKRKKMSDSNRRGYEKCHEICFKDICLNETCRLVFKIMNKGNGDFHKE